MRLRRTLLYVPGNNPAHILVGSVCGADVVVLDLEDAVAPAEKDAARELVALALGFFPWSDVEVGVRINPVNTEIGKRDLLRLVPAGVKLLRVPKVESAEEVSHLDSMLTQMERDSGRAEGEVHFIASIETARALVSAPLIAQASKRLDALSLGGEDLTQDFGAARTKEGDELTFARLSVIAAARSAGIDAIDTVFSMVDDSEALYADSLRARRLGFDGKSVVSPRQIAIVNKAFQPSESEIAQAERVVNAQLRAFAEGSGVTAVGGQMVDAPVYKRAQRVLQMAGRRVRE